MDVDYQCLNQPVVAILNHSQQVDNSHANYPPWFTSSVFEPTSHALNHSTPTTWARMVPYGLSDSSLRQLLHRSHHSMAHIQSFGGRSPHLFLLWGGYGENMSALSDMWVIYLYAPGRCTPLQSSAASWWTHAWCFTAVQVSQTGAVPAGRAYAKMAVLQVR